MNLQALGKICAEAKTLNLYEDADGVQWAGTGSCVWRLPENLGTLTTDALCAIWDVSAEKAAGWVISRHPFPDAYCTDDYSAGERELLWWVQRRLVLDGVDILPLKEPGGEVYTIKTKYIRPGKDAEQPSLCLRKTTEGAPYIVCKDGMFVQAVIIPQPPAPEQVTWLADVLQGMTVG